MRIPACAVVAALALTTLSPPAAVAATETLRVDLASSTGAFRGGATVERTVRYHFYLRH